MVDSYEVINFDDDAARLILERLRWGESPKCTRCGEKDAYWMAGRRVHKCRKCHKFFSVTSGTVFDSRKIPLGKLVTAILMVEQTEGNVTASAIAREIGVTFKTALVLKRRIKEGHLAPGGLLSERPVLNRWYWQGFNFWKLDAAGNVIRENRKTGEIRLA